jgi:hypothetical protein
LLTVVSKNKTTIKKRLIISSPSAKARQCDTRQLVLATRPKFHYRVACCTCTVPFHINRNCYSCDQPGHIGRDCKEQRRNGGGGGGEGGGNPRSSGALICRKCKHKGHIARDCKNTDGVDLQVLPGALTPRTTTRLLQIPPLPCRGSSLTS